MLGVDSWETANIGDLTERRLHRITVCNRLLLLDGEIRCQG